LKVHLFFRKPTSGFRSIEELFQIVINAFDGLECVTLEVPEKKISPGRLWNNLTFAKRNRGEVNHITGDVHYLAMATGRNTVLTIHDSYSGITGPWYRKLIVKLFWFWIPALLVNRITTISEKSRREIELIIPFAKNKITVIPNSFNPQLLLGNRHFEEVIMPETQKPIVLHVGTKSNKNLERTIEAMTGLPYKMYIIGQLTDHQADLLAKRDIDFTSFFNLPYSEVAVLYHQCSMVCFASLYEGFGMPIIEGQLVGKPVLTSNIDPMPWVAGYDGAHLVDPYNVSEIRVGIQKLISDKDYRDRVIECGLRNVQRFEPGKIADMYKRVYMDVMEM
jgi:glycosyltransferase involved in cell wall biosynthesis